MHEDATPKGIVEMSKATALQYSMFDALPTYVCMVSEIAPVIAAPEVEPVLAAKEKQRAATPDPVAQTAAAVPGLGGKARVGDWVVLSTRSSRFARDFGYTAGHVKALVHAPFPVAGVLLAYAHREAGPDKWTHIMGGANTVQAYEDIAEVWRKGPGETWSQVQ